MSLIQNDDAQKCFDDLHILALETLALLCKKASSSEMRHRSALSLIEVLSYGEIQRTLNRTQPSLEGSEWS